MVTDASTGNYQHFLILVCAWADRALRYSVSKAGSSEPTPFQERIRWRQDETEGDFQAYQSITMPEVAETHYASEATIDRHNCAWKSDLDIEKVEWSFRVNSSLLPICFVDAWLAY